MKKVMAMLVGIAVAGVAVADLSVNFQNGNVAISSDGNPGTWVSAGTLIQLVWHPTGSQTIAGGAGEYNVAGGALLADERLLDSVTVNAASPGFFGPSASLNSDADVNTGVFFTRIFTSAAGGAGEAFIDVNVVDASLYVYNPADTATTYSANATGQAGGTFVDATANGTIVAIPEPATIGLMGIAGLGLFMARRKARR